MNLRKILEALDEKSLAAAYKAHSGKEAPEGAEAKTLIDEMVEAAQGKTITVGQKELQAAIAKANEEMGGKVADLAKAGELMQKKIDLLHTSNPAEPADQKALGFIGKAAKLLHAGDQKGLRELEGKAIEEGLLDKKDLSGQTDANGGFLVPTLLHKEVKRRYQRYGFIEKFFEHITMATDSLTLPNTFNEAVVSMVGELATGSASDLVIANPELVAKKATAKYVTPNELIEDNYTDVELGTLLLEKLTQGFEKNREQQIINGSGSGNNHTGLLVDTGITQALVMDTGKTKVEDITLDLMLDLTSEVPEMFEPFGVFIMNPRAFKVLLKEKDNNGQYQRLDPNKIRAATKEERARGILGEVWGFTVLSCSFFPAPTGAAQADKKIVFFGDLSFLGVVGEKRAMSIKKVTEATVAGVNLAEADATGWVGFERFAWLVAIPSAGAFLKTAAT